MEWAAETERQQRFATALDECAANHLSHFDQSNLTLKDCKAQPKSRGAVCLVQTRRLLRRIKNQRRSSR
jgi:hypothetical protein